MAERPTDPIEQDEPVTGPQDLPLVALRETVIFPEMIVPLQVGREKSVNALNAAVAEGGPIALVTQRQAEHALRVLDELGLASIMQVADRTDLLALNAALEGTRAGEAGKGFTLVAAEMRSLAESVMESVSNIRKLLKEVRDASQLAVEASKGGTTLSEHTTESAREIALITQQQRKATTQVDQAMEEMTQLLHHTIASIKQATSSAESLSRVFAKLRTMGIDVRASDVVVDDVVTLLDLVAGDRVKPRGSFAFNGKLSPKHAVPLGLPA